MAPPIKDVTVAEFAELNGVTAARVYQWIQEGMPHRKRKNRPTGIVPREAIQWRVDRAEANAKPKYGTDDDSPGKRKTIAEAEFKELQVQQMRETLVPIADFEEVVGNLVAGFAAVAGGRLQRFEREMVAATTPAAARKISQRIHQALMAGAQDYAEQIDAEATALESPPDTVAA
jgi:phage terminase Nu1 subunit (DNA packaging protein)